MKTEFLIHQGLWKKTVTTYFVLKFYHKRSVRILFTSFSCAVFQCMGTAMVCLVWMSSAVLYWIVLRFLARLVKQKCYSYKQKTHSEHCSRPLFTQGRGSRNLSVLQWNPSSNTTPLFLFLFSSSSSSFFFFFFNFSGLYLSVIELLTKDYPSSRPFGGDFCYNFRMVSKRSVNSTRK